MKERYVIHSTETSILREGEEPNWLRTQYQVINHTKVGRNQEVIKNENDELGVKPSPKKSKGNEKHKIVVDCPNCKQRSWIEIRSMIPMRKMSVVYL